MPISSFFSPFYLGDYDRFAFIVDPIDDSEITHANAVKRFVQFLAAHGTRVVF
ncbi:MAG TPA: hypothetical protein VLK23_11970 [Thermodesulfobacteriota bacterium]|nr:hypothetical protein [Thermodesulfobacteriota bacterium]